MCIYQSNDSKFSTTVSSGHHFVHIKLNGVYKVELSVSQNSWSAVSLPLPLCFVCSSELDADWMQRHQFCSFGISRAPAAFGVNSGGSELDVDWMLQQ